ncbi:hypothetical protein [Corynebacterium macginleyi]|uniref:hypothetical protein n=1 Tax=Corynebacterium macginleyi TaxID=38290 RepID=UPI002D7F703E|nr:hypothetical protein [Corynebacterium macginleyi]
MFNPSSLSAAASVKTGAALAVCMLACSTVAGCSNSERDSTAQATNTTITAHRSTKVPPRINEFLKGDEDHSISYIRLHDGMYMGSAAEHDPRPALSLIKLYIAAYVIEQGEYEDKYEALGMIASSSDKSAEELFKKYPDSIDKIAKEYDLESTKAGENWGYSETSTYDVVSFIAQLIKRDETHPVLVAMAHADPVSEDGYDQNYGTAKLSNVVGSKWGWSNDRSINSSVSFGKNFVAAASINGSADDLTDYVKSEISGENLGKATERFLKYKDGEDVPPIEKISQKPTSSEEKASEEKASEKKDSEKKDSEKKDMKEEKASEKSSEPKGK